MGQCGATVAAIDVCTKSSSLLLGVKKRTDFTSLIPDITKNRTQFNRSKGIVFYIGKDKIILLRTIYIQDFTI